MVNNAKLTVLFFPWSHGVGFGYIGRALTIAESLQKSGYRCVFGCDTKERIISRSGMEVVVSGDHGEAVPDMGNRRGEYIPLDNLDTVYAIERYYHTSRIWQHLKQDLEVVDTVKPDLVVVDMQPTASIAARHRGIPLLSVADSDFLRDDSNSWMHWLSPDEANILPYPSCLNAFNFVLSELQLPTINHVSDLLWGNLTLLASIPELEVALPPLNVRGQLEYIGPVFWDPPWSNVDKLLHDFGTKAKGRIYLTLGHGGKVSRQDFQTILDGCDNEDWSVFVSLGFRPPEDMPQLSSNAIAGGFTGISKPIAWADVVISHGGYATVLTSLMYGKPSIVIPYMSEQEANGILFVEGQDAGFVLRKTVPGKHLGKHFVHEMRYSGTSVDGVLDTKEIVQALQEIFNDERYKIGAQAISQKLVKQVQGRSFSAFVERVLESKQ